MRSTGQTGNRQARREEERYRLIAEVASDWAFGFRISPDARLSNEWMTLGFQRISGYTPSELNERDGWMGLLHPDDRQALRRHCRTLLGGKADTTELRILTRSGETRWIRISAQPFAGDSKRGVQVVGSAQDISARRQAEADRSRLIAELEQSNIELERFAEGVAEELKRPLAGLEETLASLETALAEGDDRAAGADVSRIRASTRAMRRLVDGLLDLSRLGRVTNALEEVALADLAHSAVTTWADRIAERGVEVRVEALPRVFGDRVRLLQLFRILIEGALDSAAADSEPRVEIGCRREDGGRPVCYVRGNGTGLDPSELSAAFTAFGGGRGPATASGVGMALARRIVETHGGRIWAESEGPAAGTCFCFTLPA